MNDFMACNMHTEEFNNSNKLKMNEWNETEMKWCASLHVLIFFYWNDPNFMFFFQNDGIFFLTFCGWFKVTEEKNIFLNSFECHVTIVLQMYKKVEWVECVCIVLIFTCIPNRFKFQLNFIGTMHIQKSLLHASIQSYRPNSKKKNIFFAISPRLWVSAHSIDYILCKRCLEFHRNWMNELRAFYSKSIYFQVINLVNYSGPRKVFGCIKSVQINRVI